MNTDECGNGQGLSRRAALGRGLGAAAAALLAAWASSGGSSAAPPGRRR